MKKQAENYFRRIMQFMIAIVFLFVVSICLSAQTEIKVKGVVTSETDSMPLTGVNVVQKGTTNGTSTDIDGKFSLTVSVNSELDFSYLGFVSRIIKITPEKELYNIVLKEDYQSLEEVVVVGYGVQKKKLVTGSTVQLKGDDIQKLNTVNALSALQSQTPGVNITQSSGMPGEGFKVNIRGLGTTGDSAPLYIIDGITGGDISNLNPADIESIDVLKDAASASIYGSRAANGVILITTKQGKEGKASISYDGYFGIQNVYKKAKLLNAQEYMMVQNEGRVMDGNEPWDFKAMLPEYQQYGEQWQGTNWLEEALNKNAPIQNHALNITGGTNQSVYSLGLSYTNQEGIIGKSAIPKFERYTFRINTEHKLLKAKDFDIIKVGENLTFTFKQNNGIGLNGRTEDNSVAYLLKAEPVLPAYNSDGGYYDQTDKMKDGWTWDPYALNPMGLMSARFGNNANKNKILRGNIYLEIQPIKNLIFRTSFGLTTSSNSFRKYIPVYNLSSIIFKTEDETVQSMSTGHSWMWENTLSYKFNLKNTHAFDIMVGQSAEKSGIGESMYGSNRNSLFSDFEHSYLSNVPVIDPSKTSLSGSPWGMGRLVSFFGRVNYNYQEKYMATVSLRSDGSSNFARGNRWGYFPSVSAGWLMTNEAFMEQSKDWLDFLKIRASWGQNGNANISNFQYLATIAFDAKYFFGSDKTYKWTGAYPNILPNPDVTWETSEQLDLGFDARFLNRRLGFSFDYYEKTTKDWLVQAPILDSYGAGAPYINGGDVRNRGMELAFSWNDKIGDFSYGANLNVAYNKNEVTRISNSEGIIHGEANVLFQASTEMYRAQVGYPMGYFYGYKTLGVFQNETEITNYNGAKLDNVRPGDLIFEDTDHNGIIDENDRCMIGNPHPDFNLGFSMNFAYKGFDLSFTATGVFGNQIMRSYREWADTPKQNFTRDILGRWHGEGTSDKLPRLTGGTNTNWQYVSDIYMENGSYLRMQNITFGYDFKHLFPKIPLTQARLFLTAQNLFTITGYSGMDPEVGYGDSKSWVSGIDLGFYPSPKTYLVGVNLKF